MKNIHILFELLLFPILFLSNIWRSIFTLSSHTLTKKTFVFGNIPIYHREVKRFTLIAFIALFTPMLLFGDATCQGCDCSLDTTNNSFVTIPTLDGATDDAIACLSGSSTKKDNDYYLFTVRTDGILHINTTSPDDSDNSLEILSSKHDAGLYSGDGKDRDLTYNLVADEQIIMHFKGLKNAIHWYQADINFTTPQYVENADDICYEESTYEGWMCIDMGGMCKGGIGCKTTYPLKNIGDSDLSDVNVFYNENGMGGTMANNCAVTPSGSCSQESNVAMGPMGMLGTATSFDFSNDITPTQSDAGVSTKATMSMSCLNSDNLYATYTKNGQKYRGVMKPCGSNIPTEPSFEETCGIFPSVLTSYEHLKLMKNPIIQSCYISYPEGNFTDGATLKPTCYVDSDMSEECVDGDDDTDNGNCTYAPPPDNRFAHDFIATSDNTSTTNSDRSATLSEYEYGNISFTRNSQNIHFDPQTTYSGGSSRKLMIMGDITLAANNQVLTFEEGDYYFKNLDFQRNGVKIQTKGDVKFFISNDFTYAGNGADITDSTSSLFVYVGGDADISSTGGGNGWLGMFMYVEGDVTVASNSNTKFYGGVTSEGMIDVSGNNFQFEYNAEGAADLGFPSCDSDIVQFQADQYDISEDSTNPIPLTKTIHPVIDLPNGPAQRDFNISYTTYDGTAIRGSDYISKSETVTIHKGDSNLTLDIDIYNDPQIELDEYFFIQLHDPQPEGRATLNDHNTTKIMILAQEDSPICFSDDFESGILDDKWRTLKSSGSFTPGIVDVNGDKRLRVTPSNNNISTAVMKDYEFDTTQNLIIVEFDYYAYGGCNDNGSGYGIDGGDGIVNVLFDSAVGDNPTIGGYGGSLGYAQFKDSQGTLYDGFEKGWLGLGVDEYGNFANCNEDRVGGLPNTACEGGTLFNPQNHRNTVSLRGDGTAHNGYEFLQGVELTKMSPPQPKVAKKTGYGADGYYSGRYKMTVDARYKDKLNIRLERKMANSDYKTIINEFDAKDAQYNQGVTPDFIRYAITGSTGNECNNHEISWIQMRGNCQVYTPQNPVLTIGSFSAMDDFRWSGTGPKDPFDQAISTKIVGKSFDIQISSMNLFTSVLRPGITIKYVMRGGKEQSNEAISDFYDADFTLKSTFKHTFTSQKAYKKAFIKLYYCGDYNKTTHTTQLYSVDSSGCWDTTLSNDENDLNAIKEKTQEGKHLFYHKSDLFAIRPKDWSLTLEHSHPSPFRAGEDVNFTIKALDADGNPTENYREQAGTTFAMVVEDTKSNCRVGNFSERDLRSGWNFDYGAGGQVSSEDNSTTPPTTMDYLITKYDNVGKVNITITDEDIPCEETFAAIDCNDKLRKGYWNPEAKATDPDMGPTIGSDTLYNVEWIPDHFDVNATLSNQNPTGFTYLSDDLDMAAHLKLDIRAVSDTNVTTTNYNTECYAHPLDLNISVVYTPDPVDYPNTLRALRYRLESGTWSGYDANSPDIHSLEIPNIATTNIFPAGDHNGTAQLTVKLNLDREFNETINPFDMNISDIRATDNENASNIITSDFNSATISTNATYLYARAKSSQLLYDNIAQTSVGTPLSIVLYCDRGLVECDTFNGISTSTGQTNEYDWFTSEQHANSLDGNLSLQTTPATVTISPSDPERVQLSWGVNNSGVTVSRTDDAPLPLDVNISFGSTTSNWLIYNQDSNNEPDPFYRVRFIGDMGWAGFGDTGHVVDGNMSNNRNRKMSW